MRIVLANIRNNPDMADSRVRADVREIRPHADAVLWQEIGEREDHRAVSEVLGRGFWQAHRELDNPISLRRRVLHPLEAGAVRLHGGKADTSPARYLSWVAVRHEWRPRLAPFVFLDVHFVSGAWNDKPKPNKQWRQDRWNESWEKTCEVVRDFHRDGLTVFVGGDWNRLRVEKFHPKQRWLINDGIDKLAVLEAKVAVGFRDYDRIRLNSDHDARVARVRLSRT